MQIPSSPAPQLQSLHLLLWPLRGPAKNLGAGVGEDFNAGSGPDHPAAGRGPGHAACVGFGQPPETIHPARIPWACGALLLVNILRGLANTFQEPFERPHKTRAQGGLQATFDLTEFLSK